MKIKSHMLCSLCLIVLVVFSVGLSSVSAGNQDNRPRLQCKQRFDSMDTDNNGNVTKNEFLDFSHRGNRNPKNVFDSRDANNDGKLTQEEFCSGDRGRCGKGQRRGQGRGQGKGQNR